MHLAASGEYRILVQCGPGDNAMYYVYILRCQGDKLYTGITTDPVRRFAQHTGKRPGGAKYTAARRPVGFAALWEAPDKSAALRLELRIKALKRGEKDQLIAGMGDFRELLRDCRAAALPALADGEDKESPSALAREKREEETRKTGG